MRYALSIPIKDAPIIDAMKALSACYHHHGYRAIHNFMQRLGMKLS